MKKLLANKVTFFKITDFYEINSLIGKGSSSKVKMGVRAFPYFLGLHGCEFTKLMQVCDKIY